MANLILELKINSASNLVNVNFFTRMHVYAVITIRGDTTRNKQKVKTSIDKSNGSNPTWNHATKFTFIESLAREGHLILNMRLMSCRILGDKCIGEVNVPVLELLNSTTPSFNCSDNSQEMKVMTYQVRTKSGKKSGSLNFSYRFKPDSPVIINHNSVDIVDLSLTAYPPPKLSIEDPKSFEPSHHLKHLFAAESTNDPLPVSYDAVLMEPSCSSIYDKSSNIYNHVPILAPPPKSLQDYKAYDYAPPSPTGYEYGGPSYQEKKEIRVGPGLGAELLGGLIIGDIVSDVANCFDL